MVAHIGLSQGVLTTDELSDLIADALPFLQEHGDPSALASALGVQASMAALAGDLDRCMELCLDLQSLARRHPSAMHSGRASINTGVALLSLGAYGLAADRFDDAMTSGRVQPMSPQAMIAAASNLSLALSREMLIAGRATSEVATPRRFDLIESVLTSAGSGGSTSATTSFTRAGLAHVKQLQGDLDAAAAEWGDLDATSIHPSEAFTRYLCLIEAPLALHRGDLERALLLTNRCVSDDDGDQLVPLQRVAALRQRSEVRETMGDLAGALADSRHATELALQETSGRADVMLSLIDERVELELDQRRLLDRTTELTEQALLDEVSRVGNRRAYEERLEDIRVGPARDIAVLLLDLDGFKEINDRYGHGTGDRVIARSASIASQMCRNSDLVFRYGGDEFAVIADTGSLEHALLLAERIRSGLLAEPWTLEGIDEAVTCSVGVEVGPSVKIHTLATRADEKLYAAKQAGRNRVRPAPVSG